MEKLNNLYHNPLRHTKASLQNLQIYVTSYVCDYLDYLHLD